MNSIISPFYTSKNLIQNIKEICKNCSTCIKNKSKGQNKYGLMSHLGPAENPLEIVSIDTIGGFGGTRSTKKYLRYWLTISLDMLGSRRRKLKMQETS